MKIPYLTGFACAAWLLSAAALAQSQAPQAGAEQGGADADMSSASVVRPKTGMEARMSGVSAGTQVQTAGGESLGTVKDIVPNADSGRPDYVLIATRAGEAAVPYATVAPLFHDGRIVLERSWLEGAPHVSESQLQNRDKSSAQWKQQADRYWGSRNVDVLR